MIAPSRPAPQAYRLALTAAETADALGISERTLASMVSAGTIPFTRIGARNLRFPVVALQRWLDSQTTMPAGIVHDGPAQQADSPDDLTGGVATDAKRAASGRARQ